MKKGPPCNASSAAPLTTPTVTMAASKATTLRAARAWRPCIPVVGLVVDLAGLVTGRACLLAGRVGRVTGRACLVARRVGRVTGRAGLVAGPAGKATGGTARRAAVAAPACAPFGEARFSVA